MAIYLAAVALIVFWPTTGMNDASIGGIWAVLHSLGAPRWISPTSIEFCTNVVLFLPLSFLGSVIRPGWDWGRWLLVGFNVAATIELAQFLFLPGRVPSILDVTANTLGAIVGYLLITAARRA